MKTTQNLRILIALCAMILTTANVHSQYRPIPGSTAGGLTPGGLTPGGLTPGGLTPGGLTPGSGGGDPPPEYRTLPIILPQSDDDEMKRLRELIRRYNEDESIQAYMTSERNARALFDRVKKVVLVITAIDPEAKIADLIAKRIEKEAVAVVERKLASDLAKIKNSVSDWGVVDNAHTQAERRAKLVDIHEQEKWLNTVTRQAIAEANTGRNQTRDTGNSKSPTAAITVNTSSSARTSRIAVKEGLAMRQLREVAAHGWSGVLNEQRAKK